MQRLVAAYRALERFWLSPSDPRVYALVRITFAITAICNLIDLWPHRQEFFSKSGLIDLATLQQNIGDEPYYSVFLYASEEQAVTAIFVIALISLACLGLGILQRPAAIVAFVWHLSYSYRAFPIIHGWDEILRIVAFVIMISPTSDTWSIKRLFSSRSEASAVSRHGLVLLQLQLFVIYWQTLWLKLADEHWRSGEFVAYFQLSMYSRAPLEFWAHAEILSSLLTFGTLLVEFLLPLLLISRRTRGIGFAVGFGFHFGILALSKVWLFSLAICILYFAFLESENVTRLERFGARIRWRA